MHVTLTQSLRALEVIRDADIRRADDAHLREALGRGLIIDNAVAVTLRLAAVVKAAAAGDTAPAVALVTELRLDQLEVKS